MRVNARKVEIVTREADVIRAILDYCAAERIFVQRRNVGAVKTAHSFVRFNKPGMADLWGIRELGQHWECEVKRPGEEPSGAQLTWLHECNQAGAYAFWVDSLDKFITWMKPFEHA